MSYCIVAVSEHHALVARAPRKSNLFFGAVRDLLEYQREAVKMLLASQGEGFARVNTSTRNPLAQGHHATVALLPTWPVLTCKGCVAGLLRQLSDKGDGL